MNSISLVIERTRAKMRKIRAEHSKERVRTTPVQWRTQALPVTRTDRKLPRTSIVTADSSFRLTTESAVSRERQSFALPVHHRD